MATTISDLWLLTYENRPTDMREPLYNSSQIEREVVRVNEECREGRTDWTALDLEEVILEHLEKARAIASFYAYHQLRVYKVNR